MITIIDLTAELAKLTMLRGRTPLTTFAEREGTAARLAPYRDGAIFTSKFSGKGAWERHRNGDELVHIIDGRLDLGRFLRGWRRKSSSSPKSNWKAGTRTASSSCSALSSSAAFVSKAPS